MSKELDDFLFSGGGQTVAPAAAPAAPQGTPLAPLPAASAPARRAAVAPPSMAAPVARAPFTPAEVPMPAAAEVVPQVAAAASAAKAATPEVKVKSPVKSLSDEIVDNWKPLAIGALGAAAVMGTAAALRNRSVRGGEPPSGGGGAARTEPVFATAEETAVHEAQNRALSEQRQRRLEEFNRLFQNRETPAPITPAPVPPAPPAPVAPAPVAPEVEAPRTSAAVVGDQSGSKIAEAVAKDELVKPAAPEAPKVTGAAEPPARTGSGQPAFPGQGAARARMPKGGTFAAPADVPAGMAFVPNAQYYDSLANAARSREVAQAIVREKGYPSSDAQARQWAGEALKAAGAPTRDAMLAEGKKPDTVSGVFKPVGANKSKVVKVGGVAGALLAMTDLALASTPEAREAMGRAESAIKDIGISPNIFQSKGEELGRLGMGYVNAGNPVYIRELNQQLQTERDPSRIAILLEEIQKASGGFQQRMR